MKTDTMIVLKNKKRYYLMEKIEIEGINYFYAVGVHEDIDELNEDYTFLKETINNGKVFAEEVTDKNMKQLLLTVFIDQYIDSVEEET